LVGDRFASPADAVAALGAVQAQDYSGAKWALGQRTHGVTDAELDRLFDEGAILRTHVLRPTWHFVTPSDSAWLLRLTAPRVKAILAVYDRRLEIDTPLLRRSHRVLEASLRDANHLTRTEVAARLRARGIEAEGQRLAQMVMHAELDGLITSGPRKGRQFTYALHAERAPDSKHLSGDEALAELALRFFSGHGPAQLTDFAWWSGLTVGYGRRGVAAAGTALASETIGGKTYWSSPRSEKPRTGRPIVHLLPNYDELLIAYRDRSGMVDPSVELAAARIISHVVVRDGRVFGGWKRTATRDGVVLEVGPLGAFDGQAKAALHAAARDFSQFLQAPVQVTGI
jgi:winged helix DNA-binding protein